MKKHYAVMVTAIALVAALAIAIPALGSSGGGADAHASKKKGKKGPPGPQGPPGPAGPAAPTLPHGTGTNQDALNLASNCHVSRFNAPGVSAGDVVAVDIAANSGFEISASAGNNTLQTPDKLNVMICAAGGVTHNFAAGDITVGYAVIAR